MTDWMFVFCAFLSVFLFYIFPFPGQLVLPQHGSLPIEEDFFLPNVTKYLHIGHFLILGLLSPVGQFLAV